MEHWTDDSGLNQVGLTAATLQTGLVRQGLRNLIRLLESTGNEKDAMRARAAWRALDQMKRMEEL